MAGNEQNGAAIGHAFYDLLDRLLREVGFDALVTRFCPEPGAGAAPRVYFRMLLVGYFEDIDSLRGIAWRCRDSWSLHQFLGCLAAELPPDQHALAETAVGISADIHDQVFSFVLKAAAARKLFEAEALLASEVSYREARAAMKCIQRQDVLDDHKEFLLRLAQETAIENPADGIKRDGSTRIRSAADLPRPRSVNSMHVMDAQKVMPKLETESIHIDLEQPGLQSPSAAEERYPDWAISYGLAALRTGSKVPQIEERLVEKGLRPSTAAFVVDRCVRSYTAREPVEFGWHWDWNPLVTMTGAILIGCVLLTGIPLLANGIQLPWPFYFPGLIGGFLVLAGCLRWRWR